MTRPAPEQVEHVVASVPRNRREVTTVSVVATGDDWHVDLKIWRIFPDGRTTLKRPGLRLGPDQLHDIAAALRSIAVFRNAQARETATAEELPRLIDQSAEHERTIVAAVATKAAVFLRAFPDKQPFRVFVGQPSILAVFDHDGVGPGAFNYTCLRAALKIAKTVVLTAGNRDVDHYHDVGNRAMRGESSIIIESTRSQLDFWKVMLTVEAPGARVLDARTGRGVGEVAGSA